jgi:hypothetical protein
MHNCSSLAIAYIRLPTEAAPYSVIINFNLKYTSMPQLQIHRKNEYVNKLRNIKLFLDGKELGLIQNDETLRFDIPTGNHQLKAKIDWCSSNTASFEITEGQNSNFELSSFTNNQLFGMVAALVYSIVAANKYLRLTATV